MDPAAVYDRLDAVIEAIAASGADVALLQEVDFASRRTYDIDQLQLAAALGWGFGTRDHLGVPLSPLAALGCSATPDGCGLVRASLVGIHWCRIRVSASPGPHPAPALPAVFPVSHRANGRYAVRRQNRTLPQCVPGTPRYCHAAATSAN